MFGRYHGDPMRYHGTNPVDRFPKIDDRLRYCTGMFPTGTSGCSHAPSCQHHHETMLVAKGVQPCRQTISLCLRFRTSLDGIDVLQALPVLSFSAQALSSLWRYRALKSVLEGGRGGGSGSTPTECICDFICMYDVRPQQSSSLKRNLHLFHQYQSLAAVDLIYDDAAMCVLGGKVGVGASGAIYAMMGGWLAHVINTWNEEDEFAKGAQLLQVGYHGTTRRLHPENLNYCTPNRKAVAARSMGNKGGCSSLDGKQRRLQLFRWEIKAFTAR